VAPPIYTKNINNSSVFQNELIKIADAKRLVISQPLLILFYVPEIRYSTIINYLLETDTSFQTFLSRHNRPYIIVIKNLHHSTLCTDISASLLDKIYFVKLIINMKNKNKCAIPIFFVDLIPQVNNINVYKVISLLNTVVIIEKSGKIRRDPHNVANVKRTATKGIIATIIRNALNVAKITFPRNAQNTEIALLKVLFVPRTIRLISKVALPSNWCLTVIKNNVSKNVRGFKKWTDLSK
jgi:hypothetical protein